MRMILTFTIVLLIAAIIGCDRSDTKTDKTKNTPGENMAAENRPHCMRNDLTKMQEKVLKEQGTEPAFSGKYWDTKTPGVYRCAGCGQELFRSDDKFESGTGWPSFTQVVESGNVETDTDTRFGMTRIEVHCSNCGGHLGHVFDDGPDPTGKRYCINSASLELDPEEE